MAEASTSGPPLHVLVIAGDPLARAGLSAVVNALSGFHVVAQVAADEPIQAALDVYTPQLCLWDLGWSSEESWSHIIDAFGIASEAQATPLLALAAGPDQAGRAWRAGVRNLISRSASEEVIAAALPAVGAGLWIMDPALLDRAYPLRPWPIAALDEPLTARETEVLRSLAQGLANKEIARQLGISEHTVKFHINSVLGKLGAQSRTEAVVRATRLGLVML